MPHVIIGTAGHIDHGKTALVKALTGVNTDRLKEEKERGLTIDIGFAHLGDSATIIDVPGHEKFIRNMVAGVSTIDLVLFVVAADDGVMPQTREHLDILRILQVKQGIIVITKCDLVEDEWLALVADDIDKLVADTFLKDEPRFRVSTIDGHGIPELRKELQSRLSGMEGKRDRGVFWLPVDRAFTMQGFGTVITGTVLSGTAHVGDVLFLLPQQQLHKVRGLQNHGRSVDSVSTGDRAAINLQGLEKQHTHRGNVLTKEGYTTPTTCIDARVSLLASAPRALKSRMRIRLHIGTAEVMARIQLLGTLSIGPGQDGFVQFRLEQPVVTRRLDLFVIRQYSPTVTIGGGTVLDSGARPHGSKEPGIIEKLKGLEQENPAEVVEQSLIENRFTLKTAEQLANEIAIAPETVHAVMEQLIAEGRVYRLRDKAKSPVAHKFALKALAEAVMHGLTNYHASNKHKLGLHKAELKKQIQGRIDDMLLDKVIGQLSEEGHLKEESGIIRAADHEKSFVGMQKELRERIADILFQEGLSTSSEAQLVEKLSLKDNTISDLLGIMIALREVIRVEGDIYFHPQRVVEAEKKLIDFLATNGEITVSQFRECLGISRKYALPLLLYFDGKGTTRREGDIRVPAQA